jgi:hypothetical protein
MTERASVGVSSSLRLRDDDPSRRVPAMVSMDDVSASNRRTESIHDRVPRRVCPLCRRRVHDIVAHTRAHHPGQRVDLEAINRDRCAR